MIRSVIFDIGGVLADFDWDAYINRYFDKKTAEKVTSATWHNPDWEEFDKGILSFDEVMKKLISSAPDYEKEIRFIMEHIGECPKLQPYTIPWINELKRSGVSVYYLSNYFEYLMNACPEAVSFTDHMDGGIFSCHEHITKPDTGIYLRLCSRYGLDPSECLFIDDRPVNTAGAVRSGMNAFLFESYEKNYHEIMEIISGKRKTLMQ